MGILNLLIGPITSLLGRLIPDPAVQAQAKLQLLTLAQQGQLADLDAQTKQALASAGIVQAEAESKNWLTAAWRPITMLVFVGLIVCRLFGFTSLQVSAAEYMELWALVKLGLGGYVAGRSLEKIATAVAPTLGKKS